MHHKHHARSPPADAVPKRYGPADTAARQSTHRVEAAQLLLHDPGAAGRPRCVRGQCLGRYGFLSRAQTAETHQLLYRIAGDGRLPGRPAGHPVRDTRLDRAAHESVRMPADTVDARRVVHDFDILLGGGVDRSVLGDSVSAGVFAECENENGDL